jgi:hypothetical protein
MVRIPLHIAPTRVDCIFVGKKQLNQLITLLDKEGGIRGSNRNADLALRSTRAKREAEEAGKSHNPHVLHFIR